MATAITPLANITLSSSAATVTFSSISQVYRDLVLVMSGGVTTGGTNEIIWAKFNADSGTNYNRVYMRGNGSTALSGSSASISNGIMAAQFPGSVSGSAVTAANTLSVFDYSTTDKHKSALGRMDVAGSSTWAAATRWASTSAITSIALTPATGSFQIGSTFALYGVSA